MIPEKRTFFFSFAFHICALAVQELAPEIALWEEKREKRKSA